ncbi:DUF2064 domain-containing protein [Peptostreptococcus equinus]|uniref:DUF2064 domain-containing protein n=1 Tax=Peptostreptococcus equinus TaxID=3003601 RepID=A0ABY7JRM3_9FIRM|nr:DUF2064 domain-containing protein [Peptostreptococcus sp. CBA3647]WAW15799.1 DUF2064 domain-containing protein [Peptostreptococcus sp. CBA3647]
MKETIIYFTRIPSRGYGKNRLKNFLNEEQRYELNKNLILNNYKILKECKYNICVYYNQADNLDETQADIDGIFDCPMKKQIGKNLGAKMYSSICKELEEANKVVLVGSDLTNLSKELITECFELLDIYDLVVSPTEDGGYGIIAMKEPIDVFSGITYSNEFVLENTINIALRSGYTCKTIGILRDIDVREDIVREELGTDKFEMLGFGEYNLNYKYLDKDKNPLVYRINMKSQMDLGIKQIEYEYKALKELEGTKVVPKVCSYSLKSKYMPYGSLKMQYLEGRPLDYDKDMNIAAYLLSKIHNHKVVNDTFIHADKPFKSMFNEFTSMFSHYQQWDKKDTKVEKTIEKFLQIAKESGLDADIENQCIINTELNNRNFIIGEKSYIIDWEKPIIGECEQDLAHFLVPTTTNWKTEKILDKDEIENFLNEYSKFRYFDTVKLNKYLMFNTLRGVTWCSMAKVEYSDESRALKNDETLVKINKFLSKDFLDYLYEGFYKFFDKK